MPSASDTRAPLPRSSSYARTFVKDWERLSRSGRYDMPLLRDAMLLLIGRQSPLGPKWLDHQLKGKWRDHRECHIGGDFLPVYRMQVAGRDQEQVTFVRAGTHAELFDH